MPVRLRFPFVFVTLCFGQHLLALGIDDFRTCIGPTRTDSTCQLDSGTYLIDQPLQVGRPNFSIIGTFSGSNLSTRLQRKPELNGTSMFQVGQPDLHLSGIFIQGFIFDGAISIVGAASSGGEVNVSNVDHIHINNCFFQDSPNIALTLQPTVSYFA